MANQFSLNQGELKIFILGNKYFLVIDQLNENVITSHVFVFVFVFELKGSLCFG